jgi:hypothetical protein
MVVECCIERAIGSAAERGQSCDDALEMGRQARCRGCKFTGARIRRADADRPAPFLEHIEYIAFAELDRYRPRAGIFQTTTFDAAIDTLYRKLQGNAAIEPVLHQIESRTGKTDEMPFIPATQVLLDLPQYSPTSRSWNCEFGIWN